MPARRTARSARASRRPRRRLRRLALVAATVVLLGPPCLILLYRVVPPPITPLMVIRLAEGEGLDRNWEPLEAISPELVGAVIAAEDNLFCQHWGFDFGAFQEAIADYRDGDRLRGASTVTMQTAKNLFLWPGRNYVRKALEAYLTVQLELLWPKRRILEVYLNIAEWGPGVYGAAAAADRFLGRSVADLPRRHAALMAVVLPNPRGRSLANPSEAMRAQAATVARRIDQIRPLLDCVQTDRS